MSTKDKVAMFAGVVGGAAIGQHFWDIAGAIVGALAGLGVLVVVYGIADEVDMRLSEHYATKR